MEIAVVMLDGTVAFHSLVNPGIPIPQFVAGLTGIDAKMVRHAPTFDAIVDQLLAALEGCVFVAHNARFDWAFVSTEIERATGLLLQGPHFGIEIAGRHRATGDAVAAAKCLAKLLRLAQGNGATTLAALHNL